MSSQESTLLQYQQTIVLAVCIRRSLRRFNDVVIMTWLQMLFFSVSRVKK